MFSWDHVPDEQPAPEFSSQSLLLRQALIVVRSCARVCVHVRVCARCVVERRRSQPPVCGKGSSVFQSLHGCDQCLPGGDRAAGHGAAGQREIPPPYAPLSPVLSLLGHLPGLTSLVLLWLRDAGAQADLNFENYVAVIQVYENNNMETFGVKMRLGGPVG